MDFGDALQAYDLVNDGNGNYGFVNSRARETDLHLKETAVSFWTLYKLDRKWRRLEKEQCR